MTPSFRFPNQPGNSRLGATLLTGKTKAKVFISFDFDNDRVLKEFIIGQAKKPDSPFFVIDGSLKEEQPNWKWEIEAEKKIKNCDGVIVMVGPKTHTAPGVMKEVKMARKHGIPMVQVIGYKDGNYTAVKDAGRLYSWNWENLKNIIQRWS